MLDPVLATFTEQFRADISGELTEVYLSGQAEMVTWGKTKGGIPIAYEGPPITHAINWAERHGATLVTQMAVETKRRLAHTIATGIKNKRGIPGLARDIRGTFDDMSLYRAKTIARTETAFALTDASLNTMVDMGIDGKEWVTIGDADVSPECLSNAGQGVIPVKDSFSGGTSGPPQHPNCRCSLAPAKLPDKKE